MKKIKILLLFVCLVPFASDAQLMVAKMVGKNTSKFGLGYGLFTYFDFPVQSNQSLRLELMDLAFFPTKGENVFTSTADSRGYLSIKLGYKYLFSATGSGFYLEPSAGWCMVSVMNEGQDPSSASGIAGALEGGYTLAVGQRSAFNFGLKYEYDHGNTTHVLQSVGLRLSFSFGMFRRREN